MFNLIRKDMIIQKKSLLILLPILFVYLIMDISSIWLGFIFCIIVIMNAFTADEKSSISNFLNSLPYTRKEIVSSKYIGALIFTFMIIFALFIGNFIVKKELIDWKEILLVVSLVLFFVSFAFPFSYKFKSQYLLMGFAIMFVAFMVIANFVLPKIDPTLGDTMNLGEKVEWLAQKLFILQEGQLYGLVASLVIVLYICSWLLSIRIYSKKAF